MKKNLILVTGGDGRFAKVLKEKNKKLNLFFANKKQCNILKLSSIEKIIKKLRPKFLSDGLSIHDRKKIIFIPYNDIETSKKILQKNKDKINSIIIEPIQACLPLNNSKLYLKFLEKFRY